MRGRGEGEEKGEGLDGAKKVGGGQGRRSWVVAAEPRTKGGSAGVADECLM